jgi:hypothetical protein
LFSDNLRALTTSMPPMAQIAMRDAVPEFWKVVLWLRTLLQTANLELTEAGVPYRGWIDAKTFARCRRCRSDRKSFAGPRFLASATIVLGPSG